MKRFINCSDHDFDANLFKTVNNMNEYKTVLKIPAEVLTEAVAIQNSWVVDYNKTLDRKKCTPAEIERKNLTREKSAHRMTDIFNAYVRYNINLTDELRFVFDIPAPRTGNERIPAPTDKPNLTVDRNAHLEITVTLSAGAAEAKHGKPEGVDAYEIWEQDGLGAIDEKKLKFHGRYTNTAETFRYPFTDIGRTITFVARWLNHRGESGPWSDPVTISIS
ncbi:hypothetical protein Barb4_00971 [Bacteroidales bacterium Barb4]|nr:hypothetical protein Barb4_00971 [Bacteroidales bacterium Barb4]